MKEILNADLINQEPLKFFIPMIIPTVTNQQHRIVPAGKKKSVRKVIVYDSPELKDARSKFLSHLSLHKPAVPFSGPVQLVTCWLYLSSRTHPPMTYKTTRPDTDNMIKLFKDCMTEVGFWKDDAQVASELTEKFFHDIPGIYVRVIPLPSDPLEQNSLPNVNPSGVDDYD